MVTVIDRRIAEAVHARMNSSWYLEHLSLLEQLLRKQGYVLARCKTGALPGTVIDAIKKEYWRGREVTLAPKATPDVLDLRVEAALEDGAAEHFIRESLAALAMEGIHPVPMPPDGELPCVEEEVAEPLVLSPNEREVLHSIIASRVMRNRWKPGRKSLGYFALGVAGLGLLLVMTNIVTSTPWMSVGGMLMATAGLLVAVGLLETTPPMDRGGAQEAVTPESLARIKVALSAAVLGALKLRAEQEYGGVIRLGTLRDLLEDDRERASKAEIARLREAERAKQAEILG